MVRVIDLLGPRSGHGPVVYATAEGQLRLFDPPVCHGYASACVCPRCRDRAAQPRTPPPPPTASPEAPNDGLDRLMRTNRAPR